MKTFFQRLFFFLLSLFFFLDYFVASVYYVWPAGSPEVLKTFFPNLFVDVTKRTYQQYMPCQVAIVEYMCPLHKYQHIPHFGSYYWLSEMT